MQTGFSLSLPPTPGKKLPPLCCPQVRASSISTPHISENGARRQIHLKYLQNYRSIKMADDANITNSPRDASSTVEAPTQSFEQFFTFDGGNIEISVLVQGEVIQCKVCSHSMVLASPVSMSTVHIIENWQSLTVVRSGRSSYFPHGRSIHGRKSRQ